VQEDGRTASPSAFPLLHQRFAATVAAHRHRIAVDVPPSVGRPERIQWTYGELDRAAHAMARAVRVRLAPDLEEPIVAIVLGRDVPSLYAAQLAVLAAGAAFTCIDPKFPPDHVRAILDDAGVKVLLTDAAGRAWLAAHGVTAEHMLDVHQVVEEPETASAASTLPEIAASRLAYLIYTSGTTGKPKGVEIEHRSIANLVDSDVEHFALSCEDRVAQCSSPAYDSSLEETWLAFAVGAALVPLDDETVRLGPDLVPLLQRERITVLCPPPTLLRTTGCEEPHRALPLLKLLYVGGEALPQDLADRWSRGRRLENGYGPTECTVTVVRTRIEEGKPVTIGVPVRGNVGHVVDDSLNEVAEGELGELCIGGISLARGYRGMPEVTASRFVEHASVGRLYRTGDLVRRNAHGELEYHGRIDAQVKLRGYRVELGAVEACLAAFPGVREAACRVQGPASGQLLAAHVVTSDPESRPAIDALKAHCRQSLPSYMVPSRIAFCEELPRSVGGKLDRKELPEIMATAGDAVQRQTSLREPTTPFERLAAEAVARSLHLREPFSIDDDFFLTLGGDSLSAVGVVCFLRGHPIHGAALSGVTVRDLYESRTVEHLAERCTTHAAAHEQPRASARNTPERHRVAIHPLRATLVQAGFITGSVAISGWIWYALAFLALPAIFDTLGAAWSAFFLPAIGTLAILLWTPIAVALTRDHPSSGDRASHADARPGVERHVCALLDGRTGRSPDPLGHPRGDGLHGQCAPCPRRDGRQARPCPPWCRSWPRGVGSPHDRG
jgi:amino acid adenylation domain-containing protein